MTFEDNDMYSNNAPRANKILKPREKKSRYLFFKALPFDFVELRHLSVAIVNKLGKTQW